MNQVLQIPEHVSRLRGMRNLAEQGQAGLAGNPVPYLSIKSSRFTAIDAVGNQRPVGAMDARGMYLDVIIIDLNPSVSKTYYADAFDPSADTWVAPTCFSDNGTGPSSRVATPPAQTCAACPMNVWGSKVSENGKEVKACNDSKKVALLLADGTDIPFRLNIPPASLKAWKTHCQTVAANGADLTMLVSRLRFDPQATGPVLTFESISWVSPEQANLIEATLGDDKKLAALVGRDDVAKQFGAGDTSKQFSVAPVQPPAQIPHQPAPQAPVQQFMPAQQTEAPAPKRAPRAKKAPEPDSLPPSYGQPSQAQPAPCMPVQPAAPAMAFAPVVQPPAQDEQLAMPGFLQRQPVQQQKPLAPQANFGMVQHPQVTDSALDQAVGLALKLPV